MNWNRTLRRLIPYAAASGLLVGLQHSPVVETTNLLVYDLALHLRNRTNEAGKEPALADHGGRNQRSRPRALQLALGR